MCLFVRETECMIEKWRNVELCHLQRSWVGAGFIFKKKEENDFDD